MLMEMRKLENYSKENGVEFIINEMGEKRYTRINSINFPNGWRASIVEDDKETVIINGIVTEEYFSDKKYSVAMCDYMGFFDWDTLNKFGGSFGRIFCDTEDEIINACNIIKNL